MSDQVRIGLIGAGRIARVHANAYQTVAGGKLVACTDVVKESAQALAHDFGLEVAADYHELLARKDVDAVIIATPNGVHPEQMIAAAEAGKHVFCQKPIALNLADADRMIAVAKETDITFQVGFMLRFTPPIPRIHEIVESGTIGEVIAIRGA